MFYKDHLAAAKKDITSRNFLLLVDTAVEVSEEEEKSKCQTKTKTLSAKEEEEETEEERDRRIFHRFPRKSRRNPQQKFGTGTNPQQNLDGAYSSSSSFLLDHNTISADFETRRNPQNPIGASSFSSSFLFDLNKIPADDSETENPQNPNGPSSSTFLEDCKILAESEKNEMRNPRNPDSQSSLFSCLTDNKSSKRRAVQDIKRSGKSKKAKVATFSWIEIETPEWLTQLMKDTNEAVIKWGERTELKLIFERTLLKSDVDPTDSHLSMPWKELIRKDFLMPVELKIIEEDINNDKEMGIGAILFDQPNVKWGVMLKRWEKKRDSGRRSWNYALACGWNDIVKANGLKQGDDISIWSFRWGGLLCFALVTIPASMAQSSSSRALSV